MFELLLMFLLLIVLYNSILCIFYLGLPIVLFKTTAIPESALKDLVVLYVKFIQHMWCYIIKIWKAVGNIVVEIAIDVADFNKNIVDIIIGDDTNQRAITCSLVGVIVLYIKFIQHMWCFMFKISIEVGNIVVEIAIDLADFHKNIVDIMTSDDTNDQGNDQGNDVDEESDEDISQGNGQGNDDVNGPPPYADTPIVLP